MEIIGLLGATLRWLLELATTHPDLARPLTVQDGSTLEVAVWYSRLRANFERHFYVPEEGEEGEAAPPGGWVLAREVINRRGIYKDTCGASAVWADYQLRPNFLVVLAVAPELCRPDRALRALQTADRLLRGPLGVRTLDPADWAYRGEYRNRLDGDDRSVARGFNYHQGPEWVWPLGMLLQARLALARHAPELAGAGAAAWCAERLRGVRAHLAGSGGLWAGLPELTNREGAPCEDSCPTQAWSAATVLHALLQLEPYQH